MLYFAPEATQRARMVLLVLSLLVFLAAAILGLSIGNSRALRGLVWILGGGLAFLVLLASSYVSVPPGHGGLVHRKLGSALAPGQIIATDVGQRGPEAALLSPGWYLGYWPWEYAVIAVPDTEIPAGSIAVITALDGRAMLPGMTFAPAWDSVKDLLDASKFLASEKGLRGPQLTVGAPGTYRFNPMLYRLEQRPVTNVPAGTVAVVKDNAGPVYVTPEGTPASGNSLVPRGYRGLWNEALTPGQYFLNPAAYQIIQVRTTKRTYTYQSVDRSNWQINERDAKRMDTVYNDAIGIVSMDSFKVDVDVRNVCSISPENAPRVVALFGNVDEVRMDPQENEELEGLEANLVLRTVRTAVRDAGEKLNALEFFARRSEIEMQINPEIKAEFERSFVTYEGTFIGRITIDHTPAGQELLKTQTDKKVAQEQMATYLTQKAAEDTRKELVSAKALADIQEQLVQAAQQEKIELDRAKARVARADGEAESIRRLAAANAEAYRLRAAELGAANIATLEALDLVRQGNIKITPEVLVSGAGGESGAIQALAATLLRNAKAESASAK